MAGGEYGLAGRLRPAKGGGCGYGEEGDDDVSSADIASLNQASRDDDEDGANGRDRKR